MSALVIDFRTVQNAVRECHLAGRDDLRGEAVRAVVNETRAGRTGTHIVRVISEHRRRLHGQEVRKC